MQPDETARVFQALGDLLDGQRGRVRGKDRARLCLRLNLRENLLLGVEIFVDGLDHNVGAVDIRARRVGDQPRFRL